MNIATIHALAKPLKAAIDAHVKLIDQGVPAAEYQAAESASFLAEQQARYLGQHLDAPAHQRAEFLELCGLRRAALNVRLQARMNANRAATRDLVNY